MRYSVCSGIIFCGFLFQPLAYAQECPGAAAKYIKIVSSGQKCGDGGVFQDAKNSCTSRDIRATIKIDSNPNPGTFPQTKVVVISAGDAKDVGCDHLGNQHFTFSVQGAVFLNKSK